MTYILKDGSSIESIPVGRAKIVIGDVSPDGMLTICDRAPNMPGSRAARVICKCKCGNYTVLKAQSFKDGTTKSCGCYSKEIHRELGKKLGSQPKEGKDYTLVQNPYYTFIKRLDKQDTCNSFLWEIKCKQCGRIYEAAPAQIISETRRRGNNPCSCWHFLSKGVLKIKHILEENDISFVQEYSFSDCISPKGYPLRFDFYIPQYDTLIEYDGEQHSIPTNFGSTHESKEERFQLSQQYDNIKNEYCQAHNLHLIRIDYTQYKNITIKDLIPEEDFNA